MVGTEPSWIDQAAGRHILNLDRGVRHCTAAVVIGDGSGDRVRIVGCTGGVIVEVLMGGGEIAFADRERQVFGGRTISPVNVDGVGVLGARIIKGHSESGQLVFINGHDRLDHQAAGRHILNLDRGVRHCTAAVVIGDGSGDRVRIMGCIWWDCRRGTDGWW